MMMVDMEGPDPFGFGAPPTNAAAAAPSRVLPGERRVPRGKSFDDHLHDSLLTTDKEDEPVARGPVPVAAAAPLELREAVVVADGGAARPSPASTGQAATDSIADIADEPVKSGTGQQADPAVEASAENGLAGEALAADVAERLVELPPSADSKVPEDGLEAVGELAQKNISPDAQAKPDRAAKLPVNADARTTFAHAGVAPGEGSSFEAQIVDPTSASSGPTFRSGGSEGESVDPTFRSGEKGESVGPTFRSGGSEGESVGPTLRSGGSEEESVGPAFKSGGSELELAPQPSRSVPDAAVRAVVTAPAQFHAAVSTHVEFSAPAAAPRGPLPQETADSIVQSLRMQYQRGGGDAIVHIKPEHLGPVSVSLRVENGVVSAVVKADNPAVAEWLKTHEHVLREGLASSGLHLERFAIRRDGDPTDDARRGWREPEQRGRRRRSLQPESTFEVTV